jgi:superoxide reductase
MHARITFKPNYEEHNMDRRNFFKFASAGTVATVLTPSLAQAAEAAGMAGGVYYTKESPGRWGQKVATHSPLVEVTKDAQGVVLNVATSHEMKGYEHYIVKHVVLDSQYRFIAEHMFDPMKESAPLSTFKLGAYQGTAHVLSMCNKHDVWLVSVSV